MKYCIIKPGSYSKTLCGRKGVSRMFELDATDVPEWVEEKEARMCPRCSQATGTESFVKDLAVMFCFRALGFLLLPITPEAR